MRFYCTSTGLIGGFNCEGLLYSTDPIGGLNCEVLHYFNWSHKVVSIVRVYCTSTGLIGGLNCEVLLYFNWSHRWLQL